MSTESYDWTTFTRQVYINAPPDEVFRMWTTPDAIITWFIAQASYEALDGTRRAAHETIQPGDAYHWVWHQDLDIRGEILEVVDGERLTFTFGQSESLDDPIIVTVNFEGDDEETLLTLHQRNMADTPSDHVQWHMSCNLGWSFFMTNLKALLEHGADLREYDRERAYTARAVTH